MERNIKRAVDYFFDAHAYYLPLILDLRGSQTVADGHALEIYLLSSALVHSMSCCGNEMSCAKGKKGEHERAFIDGLIQIHCASSASKYL